MLRYLWPIFGAASLILACVNLFVSLRGKRSTALKLLTISLVFGMLTLLSQYAMVAFWAEKADWSAISDVVPGMHGVLTAFLLLCEGLNVAAAMIMIKRRK